MSGRKVQGKGAPQGSPEIAGDRRASANVRQMNFARLAASLLEVGPGGDEDPVIHQIKVNTRHSMMDFCGAVGQIFSLDLFFPSAATIVKLGTFQLVLQDMLAETEAPENRKQIQKAKKIFSNFKKQFENLYFFEAPHKELVISMNNFIIDFSTKMGLDITDYIRSAPKGMYE
jgi:hypothetical protein